ncbi:MAG TPA: hypothetical protein VMV10_12940 [Pirellulales bacterium]|nr:hypothetical protein [Pirellulales bacterium]
MSILLSPELESNHALAGAVRSVEPILQEHLPRTADANWDLERDSSNREILVLAVSDPWGHSVGKFEPKELANPSGLHGRLSDLVEELKYSVRRVRIEIRDALCTTEQVLALQQRLNAHEEIVQGRPRLFNRVQMGTDPNKMLITDFAIEVDENAADLVKQAIHDSGFNVRGAPLLERDGILDRVRELVRHHLTDPPVLQHAICVRIDDPSDVHLVEIAADAPYLGDGSLEGVAFSAGDAIPGARSLVIYLTSPDDLRLVMDRDPRHPVIRDLLSGNCKFVHPDTTGKAFDRDFPSFHRASQ